MTLRHKVEMVFNGEVPDAMPWFADLTYWYNSHKTIGDLYDKWKGERGIGNLHREMNVGEYIPGVRAFEEIYEGVEIVRKEEDDERTVEWNTPIGKLREIREYSPISFSSGYKERAVKRPEDLKILRYIIEHTIYKPCYDKVLKLDEELGEYGLPVVAVSGSPIGELYYHWAGITNMSYLYADAQEEFEKTLNVIGESQEESYRITCESPCDFVMIADNLVADTVGGFFDMYIKDYYENRIELLHEYGKKVMVHMDGKLKGLIEKVPKTGIDCIEAVTPKPVGDVGLDEIRNLVGEDIILWGGIPGAMFAPPFGRDEIKKQVLEIIKYHHKTKKFVIGVADEVPPNGDINLVGYISELVEKYSRY